MYCIANMCYVCLKKKSKPISNINSSLAVNKDIIHIIGYLPFNLAWLKTNEILLICDECCERLRETYRFHVMCLRNSALLQSYKNNLKSTSVSNTEKEAALAVTLNLNNTNTDAVMCKIKLENDETCSDECEQIVEVTEDLEAAFVKEEEDTSNWEVETWKWDEEDGGEDLPMDNVSAECKDNEGNAEISVNTDPHHLDPQQTTPSNTANAAVRKSYTCTTCGRSFFRKTLLTMHTRIHTHEKPYECTTCNKTFSRKWSLVVHTRIHTDARPYTCTRCAKSFRQKPVLDSHMRIHTGEKPFECSVCKKTFRQNVTLVKHLRVHTGGKKKKSND